MSEKVLSEFEDLEMEECGQQEPFTSRLKRLLDEGYTDGLSVPKELIQNADDAEATIVKIMYDERENSANIEHLLSDKMKECQGPAIWIFNNASFSDKDLENIQKFNNSMKIHDAAKIGKFGLGFGSVYNLTDVPSFISGTNIVVFDPQGIYLPRKMSRTRFGLNMDFSKQLIGAWVKRKKDQFSPYQDVFGCNVLEQEHFRGTLFRLPLRTSQQAKCSKLSSNCYTKNKVHALLCKFMETAGDMLLFTQHVKQVEIHHLRDNSTSPTDSTCLFTMTKKCRYLNSSIQSDVSFLSLANSADGKVYQEIQQCHIDIRLTEDAKQEITDLGDQILSNIASTWVICWTARTLKSQKNHARSEEKGEIQLSSIAVPCSGAELHRPTSLTDIEFGFSREGLVFCFLPLPIQTALRVHVNGNFTVRSDRRELISLTTDDMSSAGGTRNNDIMTSELTDAFIHLLLYVRKTAMNGLYLYHSLWPIDGFAIVQPLKRSFFMRIVHEDVKLFRNEKQQWVSFQQLSFVDPYVREKEDIGDIALEIMLQFSAEEDMVVTDIPSNIVEVLLEYNDPATINRAKISEEKVICTFLENISSTYWNENEDKRHKMIMFALRSKHVEIKSMLANTACIPTEPCGIFLQPKELVHPSKTLAKMFWICDGRFPLNQDWLREDVTLQALTKLGMMTDELPRDLLVDRCESVEKVAKQCSVCARERFWLIFDYLLSELPDLVKDRSSLEQIKAISFIPVMRCPDEWKIRWNAETSSAVKRCTPGNPCQIHNEENESVILLGRPSEVFRENARTFLGSVENVFDMAYSSSCRYASLLNALDIPGDDLDKLPLDTILKQTKICIEELKHPEQVESVGRIYRSCFQMLHQRISDQSISKEVSDALKNSLSGKPAIFIESKFVEPAKVAMNIKHECIPFLYKLPRAEQKYNMLYSCLGVKDTFSAEDIIAVLKEITKEWSFKGDDDIAVVKNLLENLEQSMNQEDRVYENFIERKDDIVAPDTDGKLRPTYNLVVDDPEFIASSTTHVLHSRIPPALGEALGVKLKRKHCFDEMSIGIPFGQREELVTRINGLLKAYPYDEGLLKEFLQNADDAGATEVHFIKDYRTLTDTNLFAESCGVLQGPSLCIFNNRAFTDADFEGIHDLGTGSKAGDPTKIGQYGVGFNVVYHLTDLPSFVTKGSDTDDAGVLCLFDPLYKHIPELKNHEPGMKCKVNAVRRNFPNMLLGFMEDQRIWHGGTGTLFRLPLRTKSSGLGRQVITPEDIDQMLQQTTEELFEALLFVKNVTSIKISKITNDGLELEYEVCVEMDDEDKKKRESFFERANTLQSLIQQGNVPVQEEPLEVIYKLTIKDRENKQQTLQVVQRYGFEKHELLDIALQNADIRHMPCGGVAMELCDAQISTEKQSTTTSGDTQMAEQNNCHQKCKAFCFQPLPIVTGLPVHVNGHFELDHESRRTLWDEGHRRTWNECLIRQVITPAYLTLLDHAKKRCTDEFVEPCNSEEASSGVLDQYHTTFPIYTNVSGIFWELLVKTLYSRIVEDGWNLFPFKIPSEKAKVDDSCDNKCLPIEWVAISKDGSPDQGVFNDTHTLISKYVNDPDDLSENMQCKIDLILKKIGMKIIETPMSLHESMVKSGLTNIPTSTPDNVIIFMAALRGREDGFCCIGGIDKPLCETTIGDIESLKCLIRFMRWGKNFHEMIPSLPVLLTNDTYLRQFDAQNPIFHTRFGELLPKSSHQFIHKDLFNMYSKALNTDPKTFSIEHLVQKGVVCDFGVDEFESLLKNTLNSEEYCKEIDVQWTLTDDNDTIPNRKWMILLWKFIITVSTRFDKMKGRTEISEKTFKENLRKLYNWSLVPVVSTASTQVLIPVSQTCSILSVSSFQTHSPELGEVLSRIGFPKIQEKCLSFSSAEALINHSSIATYLKPCQVLDCLYHHRSRIEQRGISKHEAESIVKYMLSNIDNLRGHCQDAKLKLRSLPLFLAQEDQVVSIDEKCTPVIILMSQLVPTEGMQGLVISCKLQLLKSNSRFIDFYKFLSFEMLTNEQLYADYILPNVHILPKQFWLSHITYIKERLLSKPGGQTYETHQKQIIKALKKLAFIEVNGVWRRACDLFSHECRMFREICDDEELPPNCFRDESWTRFLIRLGMPKEMTDQILVILAKRIAERGKDQLNDKLVEKSRSLSKYFMERTVKFEKCFDELGRIRFILPDKPPVKYSSIVNNQTASRDKFVCFRDCVKWHRLTICWSTCHVIEMTQCLPEHLSSRLGLADEPPLEKVVTHLKLLSAELVKKLPMNRVDKSVVADIFTDIYQFLQVNASQHIRLERELKGVPIIYLKEHNKLVTTEQIAINLSVEEEVQPFLYVAPVYYGKFHNLFLQLGASPEAQCYHYVRILHAIQRNLQSNPLNEEEMETVKQAIIVLTSICLSPKANTVRFDGTPLYLPNTQRVLARASSLVIVNNDVLKTRLGDFGDMNYFTGFKDLDVEIRDPASFTSKLPSDQRPKLLTDIVDEIVCLEDIEEVQNEDSQSLQGFLRSPHLLQGVCRIIKQQQSGDAAPSDAEEQVEKFRERFQNIFVHQVKGLKTKLQCRGSHVPNSDITSTCHIETKNENMQVHFYFEGDLQDIYDVLLFETPGLNDVIDICTEDILDKKHSRYVTAILTKWRRPESIKEKLDSMNIAPFDLIQDDIPAQTPPNPGEARRYVNQARWDWEAAKAFCPHAADVKGFAWICYMCHQASEKALKASVFYRGTNKDFHYEHSLAYLGEIVSPEMMNQARVLEGRLGNHTGMRYPHNGRPIPAERYSRDDATFSLDVARGIVEMAEEIINV